MCRSDNGSRRRRLRRRAVRDRRRGHSVADRLCVLAVGGLLALDVFQELRLIQTEVLLLEHVSCFTVDLLWSKIEREMETKKGGKKKKKKKKKKQLVKFSAVITRLVFSFSFSLFL